MDHVSWPLDITVRGTNWELATSTATDPGSDAKCESTNLDEPCYQDTGCSRNQTTRSVSTKAQGDYGLPAAKETRRGTGSGDQSERQFPSDERRQNLWNVQANAPSPTLAAAGALDVCSHRIFHIIIHLLRHRHYAQRLQILTHFVSSASGFRHQGCCTTELSER